MSDKTPRPNDGKSADFDDLNDLDVPTYQGKNPLPPRSEQGGQQGSARSQGAQNSQEKTSSVKRIFEQEPTSGRPDAGRPAQDKAQAQESRRPSIYERTGRAAPENIEPAKPKAAPKTEPRAQQKAEPTTPTETTSMNRREPNRADNETTQFPHASNSQQAQAGSPAASAASNDPQFYETDFDYSENNQDNRDKRDTNPNNRTAQVTGVGAGDAAVDNTAVPVAPAQNQPQQPTQQFGHQGYDETAQTNVSEERTAVDARRGTIDFGLLLLRILLGGFLVFEAVRTFFSLGGSEGLAGLEGEFANYEFGNILAIGLPTAQLAAGVFLILGLVTPVAAMVATVATGFAALHAVAASGFGLNVLEWNEAIWLSLILFGIAAVLQFTGPGLYSFDTGRGWARRPLASSWVFVIIGIAALVAVWIFGTGSNPFA